MKIVPAFPKTKKTAMRLVSDTAHHFTTYLTPDGTTYTWNNDSWDRYEKKMIARKKAVKAPSTPAKKSTPAPITAERVQEIVADMRRCAGWGTAVKHTAAKQPTPKKSTAAAVTFPELIEKFNHLANTNRQSREFSNALTALATAITNSVIKKCIDPRKGQTKDNVDNSGCNSAMFLLKSSLSKDMHTLENTHRLTSEISYHKEYTASGDAVSVCDDPATEKALSEIIHNETISSSYDLVQSAILRILEELEKSDKSSTFDIEKKYTVKRLKRKVRIKLSDSRGGYETVETSAIQESFRAVRREIMAAGSVQIDPRNGYTYIEDLVYTTNENGAEKTYYRLPKFSDLGGYVTDFNGAYTVYTADLQTAVDTDTLIDKMRLTPRQAQILSLRLKGYGAKAIATYLSIKPESVKDALKAIRKKAEKIGLTATKAEKAKLADKEIEKKHHTEKADNAENIIHKLKKVYHKKHYFHIETPTIKVKPVHCAVGSYTALKRDKIPALYVDILNGCKNPFDD